MMAAPARAAASVRTAAAQPKSNCVSAVVGAVVCLGADKAKCSCDVDSFAPVDAAHRGWRDPHVTEIPAWATSSPLRGGSEGGGAKDRADGTRCSWACGPGVT